MKLKDKIKSYSFWVSLASAVILILKVLGNRFGFTVDEGMVSDLFTALCSILVLLGIIVVPTVPSPSGLNNKQVFQETQNTLLKENVKTTDPMHDFEEKQIEVKETINHQLEEPKFENIVETKTEESKLETIAETQEESLNTEPVAVSNVEDVEKLIVDDSVSSLTVSDEAVIETEAIVEKQKENESDNSVLENSPNTPETIQVNDFASLKEMFNNERVKFAKNMNEYIFELQEEIRKAREQM